MSSDVQRLIRKIRPQGPRSFDEQVWPIYVAIAVLFSYLGGVIVSILRFDDPRVHANASTWLFVLLAVALGGLFCVRFLERRLLKRTIVLSLLMSMIINVSLLILMAWTSILRRPWQQTETKVAVQEQRDDVVVPEYPFFNEDPKQRVPQEYERPVETGEPEAEERVELTRQSTVPEHQLQEQAPTPNSSSSAQQQIAATPDRFEPPSVPRQSQTMSKLSRQQLKSELTVNRTANQSPSPTSKSSPSALTHSSTQPRKSNAEAQRSPSPLEVDRATGTCGET